MDGSLHAGDDARNCTEPSIAGLAFHDSGEEERMGGSKDQDGTFLLEAMLLPYFATFAWNDQ